MRGFDKYTLAQAQLSNQHIPPFMNIPANDTTADIAYRRVTVTGRFINKHVFITPRSHQGMNGSYIYSLFATLGGHLVYVHRGWKQIDIDDYTRLLTQVDEETPKGQRSISGSIQRIAGPSPFVQETTRVAIADGSQAIVASSMYSGLLEAGMSSFYIALTDAAPMLFVAVAHQVKTISVHRHFAYALQWFAIAVLIALLLFFYRKRIFAL